MKRVKVSITGAPGDFRCVQRGTGYPMFGGQSFADQEKAREFVTAANDRSVEVRYSLPRVKACAKDRRLREGAER